MQNDQQGRNYNHQDYENREELVIDGRDGQGKAINRGAALANGEILFILDDDASLGHTGLFRNMVRVLESDRKVGMVGASTIPRPDDSLLQKIAIMQVPRRYFPVVDVITESDMAQHPCCAIPRRVFEEIGGESEILTRGLDPDLRYRIRKKGYKIVIAPNSWIYHPLPGSLWGIFRMYFKNGQGAAFSYMADPGLVYEVADTYQKSPMPQKTDRTYRIFRFAKRFLWNMITFKMIKIVTMTAYGMGYITGFFIYGKPPVCVRKERAIYNIRRFYATKLMAICKASNKIYSR